MVTAQDNDSIASNKPQRNIGSIRNTKTLYPLSRMSALFAPFFSQVLKPLMGLFALVWASIIASRLKQKSMCVFRPSLSVSNIFPHIGHCNVPVSVALVFGRVVVSNGGSSSSTSLGIWDKSPSGGRVIWLVLCGFAETIVHEDAFPVFVSSEG